MQKNGDLYRLKETGEVVQTNTGIVVGYDIAHALDLIAKNPIGPKISDKFTQIAAAKYAYGVNRDNVFIRLEKWNSAGVERPRILCPKELILTDSTRS